MKIGVSILLILAIVDIAWTPLQSEINKPKMTQPQKGLNFQVYQNLTLPSGVNNLLSDANLGIVFTFPVPPGIRNRKLYTYQCGFYAYGFSIIHLQKQGQDILRLPLAIEFPGIAAFSSGVSEQYKLSANSAEFQSSFIAPSINAQTPGSSVTSLQKFTAGTGAGDPSQFTTLFTPTADMLLIKAPTPAVPLFVTGEGTPTPLQFFTMSLLPYYIKDLDIDSVTLELVSVYSLHAPPAQPNIQMFVGVYTE